VRRFPGSGRGRVFISIAELEEWKQERQSESIGGEPEVGPAVRPSLRKPQLVGVAAILVVATLAAWLVLARKPVPASFRVNGNALIVSDAHGREIWRKILPAAAIEPETAPDRRQLWLEDIDGDGEAEVLYAFRPIGVGEGGVFFCYSQTGVEKWHFVPGRRVQSRVEPFAPPYIPRAFAVVQLVPGGPKYIVLTSHHYLYYPDQVVLLDAGGKVVREYWHSGWLEALAVSAVDGNVYLGGISNSNRQAVMVVLDPRRFDGASSEDNDDYQLLGFRPPVERARVVFPRSCWNRQSQPQNVVRRINIHQEGVTAGVLEEYVPTDLTWVDWHFSPSLDSSRVVLSDIFRGRHHELEIKGLVRHRLTDDRSEFGELRWLVRP